MYMYVHDIGRWLKGIVFTNKVIWKNPDSVQFA